MTVRRLRASLELLAIDTCLAKAHFSDRRRRAAMPTGRADPSDLDAWGEYKTRALKFWLAIV
jgi:hypothetical protein